MIKVYVAGAYSDNNVIGVLRNIGRGEDIACQIFNLGYAPFTPWFDKEFVIRYWKNDFEVDSFYQYSIAWLQASDCVLVVPDAPNLKSWSESKGTLKEIEIAQEMGLPVFYSVEQLHAFYGE